ncbi:hypothetical protein [Lysobacter sp. CA196]|uniref:hypothetical protein n=1 Tax=Lysobacter sp. CA196 TaxID=3455606 RepID=UPI003F8D7788
MNENAQTDTRSILRAHEDRYRRSARRWRIGYRVLLVASALLSSFAAIAGKLQIWQFGHPGDVAAIAAASAAVVTTLIAALDFETNARANRRSRHEISILLLEAEKSTASRDALLLGLQDVIKRRNDELCKLD